jgi:hypothetical protein
LILISTRRDQPIFDATILAVLVPLVAFTEYFVVSSRMGESPGSVVFAGDAYIHKI